MRANPTDYTLLTPGSLPAVLSLLASDPGLWTPLAGGTELMVQYNAGRLRPRHLVSIHGLPELTSIHITPTEIRIGAGVTYTQIRSQLRTHPNLPTILPLLTLAASWTGSIANQNRGTLGGNIINASPAADSPPALLVYDATVELTSLRGTRTLPYATFHTAYKQTQLAPDELLLAITIPRPAPGLHQYLRKVGARNAQAISKVALAATALITDGTLQNPRIAVASVSHAPYRCLQTEALLTNQPITPALIHAARAALTQEITPQDDIRSTARYRTHVAANLLEQFLTGAP
jgi:CO/xanthine dehydrogenase FAD-binding subunit